MITRDNAKDFLPILQAIIDGKDVSHNGNFFHTGFDFNGRPEEYKIIEPVSEAPAREKPPLGPMPRWIWKEHRVYELISAIDRYRQHVAGTQEPQQAPAAWLAELHEHLTEVLRNE